MYQDANGKTIHTPQCAVTLPTVRELYGEQPYNDLAFYARTAGKSRRA